MFKKFDEKESVSGVQQLKSSVQKNIKAKLLEQFPHLESYIDTILPKKDAFRIVKCHDHVEILINSGGELLFFRQRDDLWMPTLRLLHKYPFFLPLEQVDKGAIRFVLSGANIMCPGLTSPGAKMTPVPKGTVVLPGIVWLNYHLNKTGLTGGGTLLFLSRFEPKSLLLCIQGLSLGLLKPQALDGTYWFNLKREESQAVMAEGKQHALAVGITSLSTDDISKVNKGIGIENCHYLNDGLWQMKPVK